MQRIPEAARVTMRALPIALWCSDYRGAVECEPAKPLFAPVRGAYVACIRIASGWRGSVSEVWRLRCGRTNDFGWVIQRERGALGGEQDVPRSGWRRADLPPGGVAQREDSEPSAQLDWEDAGVGQPTSLEMFTEDDPVTIALDASDAYADALHVLPNETYRIHWSHDRALFELFLQGYEADPERAFAEFEVREYVVQPFPTESNLSYLRSLPLVERGWVARQLSNGLEGYHAGWPSAQAVTSAVFDGTPKSLRALYLCEWLCDTCIRTVQEDGDWTHLNTLCGVVEAARSGAAIPDLAKAMPTGERAGAAYQMRMYLWGLAWSGFESRRAVQDLVDVAGLNRGSDWRFTADLLRDNPKHSTFRHPALDPSTYGPAGFRSYWFTAEEQAALVAYFDMYALGFAFDADLQAVKAHWAHVAQVGGRVLSSASRRLSAVSHVRVMRAVAVHLPRVSSTRVALVERYYRVCAQLGVRFWKEAEVELEVKARWEAYKPYLTWLIEDVGLLGELMVSTFEPYLRAYRELTAAQVESLLRYFFRYHLTLAGEPLDRALPRLKARLRLQPLGTTGKVVATVTTRGPAKELARMELLTRLGPEVHDQVHEPVGKTQAGLAVLRYRVGARGAERSFSALEHTIEVPDADILDAFPKQLAMLGASVDTALALKALFDEFEKKHRAEEAGMQGVAIDGKLYLDLVQETLAAAGPSTELLAIARGRASPASPSDWLVRGGKSFAAAGLALESLRNVVSGATTLATLLPDATREHLGASTTTDLERYLRDGETFAALVETAKGAVQVGSGTAGLCVVGGLTTLAGVALSQVVAVGLVAIAMADVVIYVETGGASPVQDFKDGVFAARLRQFQASSRPIDLSGGPSLLARQLGSLNALAKA